MRRYYNFEFPMLVAEGLENRTKARKKIPIYVIGTSSCFSLFGCYFQLWMVGVFMCVTFSLLLSTKKFKSLMQK